jgi:hypothetical protein
MLAGLPEMATFLSIHQQGHLRMSMGRETLEEFILAANLARHAWNGQYHFKWNAQLQQGPCDGSKGLRQVERVATMFLDVGQS